MSDVPKGSLFEQIIQARKSSAPERGEASLDVVDADAFPCLISVLVDLPKGAVRGAKVGKLSVFVHDGRLTVCVNVPSMGYHGFYSADGICDALTRVEGALASGKIEWRKDKPVGR